MSETNEGGGYATDLSNEQWAIVERELPPAPGVVDIARWISGGW